MAARQTKRRCRCTTDGSYVVGNLDHAKAGRRSRPPRGEAGGPGRSRVCRSTASRERRVYSPSPRGSRVRAPVDVVPDGPRIVAPKVTFTGPEYGPDRLQGGEPLAEEDHRQHHSETAVGCDGWAAPPESQVRSRDL